MTSCVSAAAKVDVDQGSARNEDKTPHLTSRRSTPSVSRTGGASTAGCIISFLWIRQCSGQPG